MNVEAALRWGKRPSAFVLKSDTRGQWGKWDILLAEAYEIVQREKCSCGLPVWLCRSDDERVRFSLKWTKCHATATVEREEDSKAFKKRKDEGGMSVNPEPKMADNLDFIVLREPYYKSLAKRNETPI